VDIVYMRSFLEVARCQSFTKAAENLGYVQSSVTAQIQKIEHEYGVVLFERYGRSIRLTSEGEQLLETFATILELYDDSKRMIARQAKGTLEIGTIESLMAFLLPPHFRRFTESFPEINLQVNLLTEPGILQAVRTGQLEIGILMDPPIEDDDLETVTVRQETLVLIAHPDHPLSELPRVGIADLEGQYLIVTEQGCTYRAALERLLGKHGIRYHVLHEFGSLEAIKQCVSYGLGIALVPRIVAIRELNERKLVALPFAHTDITFYTQIVYHKKKWLSPPIRYLIELLERQEGDSLSPVSSQIS